MTLIDNEEVATFNVGSVGREVPLFDLTDDEIEEELAERRAREARRIPAGFAAPARRRRAMSGGRRAGTFPRIPRFDI